MDEDVIKLFDTKKVHHLIILTLFDGKNLPKYCEHMYLNPEPNIDIPISKNLSEIYFYALNTNWVVHDGAVMIQSDCNPPILRGWSYRLYPPPIQDSTKEKNKGCGYNSSFDFSFVDNVKSVYLINETNAMKIVKGKKMVLC